MRPRQAPAPRAQGRRARSCCRSLCWSSCAVTGQQHTPPRVTTRALRPKRYPTPGPNRCLCQQAVNLVSLSGQSKPTPGRAPGLHGHGSVSQDVDLELNQVQSLECGQVVEEQKRDREPHRVSRWGREEQAHCGKRALQAVPRLAWPPTAWRGTGWTDTFHACVAEGTCSSYALRSAL